MRSNSGTAAWQLLHSMGHFPANAPHTLRAARTRGQLTVEELVDRHRPSDPGIRDLFVEYIRRRGAGMDYNSVNGIAHILMETFWRTVERSTPPGAICGSPKRPTSSGKKP
ncbi:hypothetical protein EV652_10669 [Kribbella steppae]|uniref:Uncharacterized protein n=1 Tax=Kribbella steppae TaxID=2512223 RepID=A0A4R2HGK0_9ACTN|nr:hypothetical protein EV652_10669 [Kribbella steppae]